MISRLKVRSIPGFPVRCSSLNRFDWMQTDWTGICHEETNKKSVDGLSI